MARLLATLGAPAFLTSLLICGTANAAPPNSDVPTKVDLAKLTKDKVAFIDRLLTVIEKDIVPKTQMRSCWSTHHQTRLISQREV